MVNLENIPSIQGLQNLEIAVLGATGIALFGLACVGDYIGIKVGSENAIYYSILGLQ